MMTKSNTLTAQVATLIGTKVDSATLEQWAESVIDNHRFASRTARTLSRFGEASSRQVRLGSPEELADAGHNIAAIAYALQSGVTASAMNKALKGGINMASLVQSIADGLDTSLFSRAVMKGMKVRFFAGTVEHMAGEELNGALANFIESACERRAEPNPVRRALAWLGESDCLLVTA